MLKYIKAFVITLLIMPECFVMGIKWGLKEENLTNEEVAKRATKYVDFAYARMKRRLHWQ